VRIVTETGRTHQIRAHFYAIGHPLVGDKLYCGDGEVYMKAVRKEVSRADLDALIPLGAAIRLVKGAYKEPASIAMQSKAEVDESYYRLGVRMLSEDARKAGVFLGLGTHDPVLIRRFEDHVAAHGVPKDSFEFEMLYGIRREEQLRLASSGYRIRVLISYGAFWFPWYMRRLAERPANMWFVVKNIFGG